MNLLNDCYPRAAALIVLVISVFIPAFSHAELKPLSDQAMVDVHAQGSSLLSYRAQNVSAVSDDFYLELGFDSGIPTEFRRLSLVGAGSSDPFHNIQGFTLGSSEDPFTIVSQQDSFTDYFSQTSETSSLVLAFPRGRYVNELGSGIDTRFNLTTLMSLEHLSGNELHTWLSFQGVSLDDTYIKAWVDQEKGLSLSGLLNLSANRFVIDADNEITAAPGENPDDQWILRDLDLSLPLGNTLYQPLNLEVTEDLYLLIELEAINLASAQEFDSKAPAGHLRASGLSLNGYELGGIEIEGIRLQHLRIETHDLD